MNFDVEKYIERVNHHHWWPATPTKWSVEESANDRAMLWDTYDAALLGRDTWKAIKRFYPDCKVECASWKDDEGHRRTVFRFVDVPAHTHDDDGSVEGCPGCFPGPRIFAYAAGIRIPEGEELRADVILRAEYIDP